ncbi:MAG: asparagine synthase (glutamine-hydrolyzing) [Gaiellaceae bacterium]
MCGICGAVQIATPARRVLAPEILDRMTDAMRHRGPNDRGLLQHDGVALGVRRLSIVDVEGGHQPVSNEEGTVWLQNGELYNHEAIRDELARSGHRFASRCDTDVIPHLYERYGVAYQEHLRGKFGIAVWDERRRRLVLSRDRLGVKPLYYARRGDLLVFASELKSLLASGCVEPSLDYRAIDAYLTLGFFPAPWTALEGVCKLLPGHRLIADQSGVRTEPYWRFPRPTARRGLTIAEHAEGLMAELEEAVRLRLMSDVPLGVMLSGGIDSSLIVALMARNMGEPVKTFSVGFAEDGDGNELADARLVAETFGCDHHELELSVADAAVDLSELSWYVDEPLADLSALGLLALSELAADDVTVTLSGQGADELLGGYRKHRAASIVSAWRHVPRPLRVVGEQALLAAGDRFERPARTLAARSAADRLLAMSGKIDDDDRTELYRGPMRAMHGEAARGAVERCLDGLADDPLAATLFIDAQLALVDDMLHYFDRASMARSLEMRVPFLDHEVVEYCAGIPSNLKVRRQQNKYILRRASRGLIPDRIIDKRKVGFFHDSTAGWLQAQTAGAVGEVLLAPDLRIGSFLDQKSVHALVARHAEGIDTSRDELILALLMLEIWLVDTLPRELGTPVSTRERIVLPA